MIPIWSFLCVVVAAVLTVSARNVKHTLSPLASLPDHILELIPFNAESYQVLGQVSRQFRQIFHQTETMKRLFYEPFPDSHLPDLINQLAVECVQSPHLHRYMSFQMKVCLFDRLMLSPDLEWDQKMSALRVLIDNIDEDVFLGLGVRDVNVTDHSIKEMILQRPKHLLVPDHLIGLVPERFRVVRAQSPANDKSSEIWESNFRKQVRNLFLPPYDLIIPNIHQVFWAERDRDLSSAPLGNASLLQFFIKAGLRVSIGEWIRQAHLYSPDLVPDLAPFFQSFRPSSLISFIIEFLTHGYPDHAAAMFKITRVCQLLASHPGSLIDEAVQYCKPHEVDKIRDFFTTHRLIEKLIARFKEGDEGLLKHVVKLATLYTFYDPDLAYIFEVVLDLMQPHIPDLDERLRVLLAHYQDLDVNSESSNKVVNALAQNVR